MEEAKKIIIKLAKKLNSDYHILSSSELDETISDIIISDKDKMITYAIKLLDFTIKHKIFAKYAGSFFKLKNLEVNLPDLNTETEIQKINVILSFLKSHDYDYYLCGGVPLYLATTGKFQRHHNDLDVLINEKDLEAVLIELYGLGFEIDDRRELVNDNSNIVDYPGHIVSAYYDDFHIGFFLFSRDKDHNMYKKNYYIQNGIPACFEQIVSSSEETLEYGFNQKTKLKMETFEKMYKSKVDRSSLKDFGDLLVLKDYINYEKVDQIRHIPKEKWEKHESQPQIRQLQKIS